MKTKTLTLLLAAAVSAGSLYASDAREEAGFSAALVRKSTGGNLAVAFREAYPLNLDIREAGVKRDRQLRVSYSELYSIDRNVVRFMQRQGGEWQARGTYTGDSDILAIHQGALASQLLVLDSTFLRVVDFFSEEPAVVGSFAIDNRGATPGRNYLERFGDSVYVVDSTLPGFRVLTLQDTTNVREVSSFRTAAPPAEIRIRRDFVYLMTAGDLTIVSVKDFLAPEPREQMTLRSEGAMRTVLFDSEGMGFVAEGSSLRVLDADPDSATFLQVKSSLQLPTAIDQIAIQDGRAFVFDTTGALEVISLPQREVPEAQQQDR